MQGSPPSTGAARLSVHDLACRRGDRVLFRGLSLELASGEACHVTGANGSGKTTLIRALAGLLAPFAGRVASEGSISMLDERTALDPDLPLGRALSFWAEVDGGRDTTEAVATMGLSSLLDIPVRYLSTGQKKRAGLAGLLHRGTDIWLLDEPLSGLDTAAVDLVIGLIDQHVASGGIAMIVSHQPLAIMDLRTLAIEDFAP